jgi:hypothetical protein
VLVGVIVGGFAQGQGVATSCFSPSVWEKLLEVLFSFRLCYHAKYFVDPTSIFFASSLLPSSGFFHPSHGV